MTPFEPTEADPEPIDADGYCLTCWGFCSTYEECNSNRIKNRELPRPCFMHEPHGSHGWADGHIMYYCKGRTAVDLKPPERLW